MIAIFVKSYWINTLANGLMVSGVALNFALLLIFTSESFPSSIRNKASVFLFMFEITGYILFNIIEMY